jgi:hypothetical protein
MNGTATVMAVEERRDSTLQRILNQVFRCSHRHRSLPITPKGEDQCYSVCLDCGKRLLQERPFSPSPEAPEGRREAIRKIGKRKATRAMRKREKRIAPSGDRLSMVYAAVVPKAHR